MKRDELLKTICTGMYDAALIFKKWTGGEIINNYAAESFMVAIISQRIMSIRNHPPTHLFIEYPFYHIKENNNISPGRINNKINKQGRVDIITTNSDFKLKYAIEVKCSYGWQNNINDFDRLFELYKKYGHLNNNNKFIAGIAALYVFSYGTSEEKAITNLENKLDRWEKTYMDHCNLLKNKSFHYGNKNIIYNIDNKFGAANSMCVIVDRVIYNRGD